MLPATNALPMLLPNQIADQSGSILKVGQTCSCQTLLKPYAWLLGHLEILFAINYIYIPHEWGRKMPTVKGLVLINSKTSLGLTKLSTWDNVLHPRSCHMWNWPGGILLRWKNQHASDDVCILLPNSNNKPKNQSPAGWPSWPPHPHSCHTWN